MISGGSAGEADKTKSWVLGIALKRSRYCIPYYCILQISISQEICLQYYKGERTSKVVYCKTFCRRGPELDSQ